MNRFCAVRRPSLLCDTITTIRCLQSEINRTNPLGSGGALAQVPFFGTFRASTAREVDQIPREFQRTLAITISKEFFMYSWLLGVRQIASPDVGS